MQEYHHNYRLKIFSHSLQLGILVFEGHYFVFQIIDLADEKIKQKQNITKRGQISFYKK